MEYENNDFVYYAGGHLAVALSIAFFTKRLILPTQFSLYIKFHLSTECRCASLRIYDLDFTLDAERILYWTRILDVETVNGKEMDKEIAAYDLSLLVGLVSKGKERIDMMFTRSDLHTVRC